MSKKTVSLIYFVLILFVMQGCAPGAKLSRRADRVMTIDDRSAAKVKIPFRMINNLVVIPLQINESEPLHFILDTGVSRIILTEMPENKELDLHYTHEVFIRGIGEQDPIKALYSEGNQLSLDGISGDNLVVIAVLDDVLDLSAVMGSEVNGLVGYDIFQDFIVELNYTDRIIYLHDPDLYNRRYQRKKRSIFWNTVDLSIENRKPYASVKVKQKDNTRLDLKLLVDSGASHAMSLYKETAAEIHIPEETLYSYLGTGLGGDIYGLIGRASRLKLGRVTLKKPVVYFPDEEGLRQNITEFYRNGSIGAEVLKRFKVFINYEDSSMIMRRNHKFRDKFYYNMAGIEIAAPYPEMPVFIVTRVREGSPAARAGIKIKDVIEGINKKPAFMYTLNDIYSLFLNEPGKTVTMLVSREEEEEILEFEFRLIDETR